MSLLPAPSTQPTFTLPNLLTPSIPNCSPQCRYVPQLQLPKGWRSSLFVWHSMPSRKFTKETDWERRVGNTSLDSPSNLLRPESLINLSKINVVKQRREECVSVFKDLPKEFRVVLKGHRLDGTMKSGLLEAVRAFWKNPHPLREGPLHVAIELRKERGLACRGSCAH